MLLNNQWFKKGIFKKSKNILRQKWKRNYQNQCDTAKAVLRWKFIVINTYIKRYQIRNLTLHLKELQIRKRASRAPS